MLKELVVPEGANIIINDTKIRDHEVSRLFSSLHKVSLAQWIILSTEELNANLATKLATSLLLLFPGNGSRYIKSELSLQGFNIETERIFDRNKPTSCNVKIPSELIENIKDRYQEIDIVDDVVASGLTINTIKKAIECKVWVAGFEPKISWVCYTWLMQKLALAKVDQSIKVDPCMVYSRGSGKVSANSLSTLLENSLKGETVRNTYAAKYFTDAKKFIEALGDIKQVQ